MTLLVLAAVAIVGEVEAAVVVEVMVALGAFMAVLAGHAFSSFHRSDARILCYIICSGTAACHPGALQRDAKTPASILARSPTWVTPYKSDMDSHVSGRVGVCAPAEYRVGPTGPTPLFFAAPWRNVTMIDKILLFREKGGGLSVGKTE